MISIGNTTVAHAVHEGICLLYLKLQGCQGVAQRVAEFDNKVRGGVSTGETREGL